MPASKTPPFLSHPPPPPPPPPQANAALHGAKGTGAAAAAAGAEGSGEATLAAAPAAKAAPAPVLDDAGVSELEGLLSVPLASLALQVLELPEFSALLACLPWASRKQVRVVHQVCLDSFGWERSFSRLRTGWFKIRWALNTRIACGSLEQLLLPTVVCLLL